MVNLGLKINIHRAFSFTKSKFFNIKSHLYKVITDEKYLEIPNVAKSNYLSNISSLTKNNTISKSLFKKNRFFIVRKHLILDHKLRKTICNCAM
jgi:hypothetical protein